jgi:ankyrin repeat protein
MKIQTKLFKVLRTTMLLIVGLPALAMDPGITNPNSEPGILSARRTPGIDPNKFELDQALWLAASKGNEPEVNRLIALKANINVDNFMNITALMIAAENGHVEVVQTLLKHGANANMQAKWFDNVSALELATGYDRLEVVKALLTTISDADAQAMRNGYYALLHSLGKHGMKATKDIRRVMTNSFVDVLVQEHMEKVVQPMIALRNAESKTARDIALERHRNKIANLLDLNNPQSQAIIRTLIKANIWHILKAKPKSKLPITQEISWDEMLGEFEPREEKL